MRPWFVHAAAPRSDGSGHARIGCPDVAGRSRPASGRTTAMRCAAADRDPRRHSSRSASKRARCLPASSSTSSALRRPDEDAIRRDRANGSAAYFGGDFDAHRRRSGAVRPGHAVPARGVGRAAHDPARRDRQLRRARAAGRPPGRVPRRRLRERRRTRSAIVVPCHRVIARGRHARRLRRRPRPQALAARARRRARLPQTPCSPASPAETGTVERDRCETWRHLIGCVATSR